MYGNGPQFCLCRDRPVVGVRALSVVGGRRRERKNEGLTRGTEGKESWTEHLLAFQRLCMHSTFLIYASTSPLNN